MGVAGDTAMAAARPQVWQAPVPGNRHDLVWTDGVGDRILGAGDYNTFLVFFVLKGASFGAFAYLPLAIVADVVDVDTAVTRQKRAGIFFAVFGAVDKIGIAIGLFIALQVLNLTGYDPSREVNEAGLWMIRLEYAVIPTFFFLLASYLVWNYPVTSERHARLIEALERRAVREGA